MAGSLNLQYGGTPIEARKGLGTACWFGSSFVQLSCSAATSASGSHLVCANASGVLNDPGLHTAQPPVSVQLTHGEVPSWCMGLASDAGPQRSANTHGQPASAALEVADLLAPPPGTHTGHHSMFTLTTIPTRSCQHTPPAVFPASCRTCTLRCRRAGLLRCQLGRSSRSSRAARTACTPCTARRPARSWLQGVEWGVVRGVLVCSGRPSRWAAQPSNTRLQAGATAQPGCMGVGSLPCCPDRSAHSRIAAPTAG